MEVGEREEERKRGRELGKVVRLRAGERVYVCVCVLGPMKYIFKLPVLF